jgi:putative hydrolase of the HAD superfamily
MKDFNNIKNFIFDLDGSIYSLSLLPKVFGQVSKRMGEFISQKLNVDLKKAKELQTDYFHRYNTSLNGLMMHHDIEPKEFLKYVHNINLDFLKKDVVLREELLKLNAKKYIYTNGSVEHAEQIIKSLGIEDLFDNIFDIELANYVPKPSIDPFKRMIKKFNIDPKETVFIEDIAINLEPAKKLGMKTVWIENTEYWGKRNSDKNFIDLKIKNLSSFLKEINILKVA